MRFINALKNDVRFQIKYGFYFLYAFFSAVYIAVLVVTPPVYQKIVSSLIVLSDPAMLGVFFVGGIWLLEKGEGRICSGVFRRSAPSNTSCQNPCRWPSCRRYRLC